MWRFTRLALIQCLWNKWKVVRNCGPEGFSRLSWRGRLWRRLEDNAISIYINVSLKWGAPRQYHGIFICTANCCSSTVILSSLLHLAYHNICNRLDWKAITHINVLCQLEINSTCCSSDPIQDRPIYLHLALKHRKYPHLDNVKLSDRLYYIEMVSTWVPKVVKEIFFRERYENVVVRQGLCSPVIINYPNWHMS